MLSDPIAPVIAGSQTIGPKLFPFGFSSSVCTHLRGGIYTSVLHTISAKQLKSRSCWWLFVSNTFVFPCAVLTCWSDLGFFFPLFQLSETKIFTASNVSSVPLPTENVTITAGQR